jgi:hypothetical protein
VQSPRSICHKCVSSLRKKWCVILQASKGQIQPKTTVSIIRAEVA